MLHQDLARLGDGVDVRVIAVALVRQLLQRAVLVVAGSESEHAQEDAALGFVLDQIQEVTLVGGAHVEVTVGRQNDAIDAALDEARPSLRVG